MPHPSPSRFDATDDAVVEYKSVSPLAIVGLIVGFASIATLLSPALWIVSVLGVLLNGAALVQIWQRSPALVGRGSAVCGLLLSTVFFVFIPAENYFFHHLLNLEARKVALAWFQAVAHKNPAAVHRMMTDPRIAVGPKADPEAYYKANPKMAEALRKIVDEPVLRTLFALGPTAQASYYETVSNSRYDTNEVVYQIFAVSADIAKEPNVSERTTFFVQLSMERMVAADQKVKWRVAKVDGPVRPSGWGT